jgi:mRNA interferase HigB
MRIVGRPVLDECAEQHSDVRERLRTWRTDVEKANWNSPLDIKARYPSASIIDGKCVVFNIKGNRYRLVAKVNFELGIVRILFADTHAEYDKIDVTKLCAGA